MYSIYLYITDEWFGSVVHRVLSALQFEVLYQIQFRALAAAAVSFLVVVVFGRRVIAQLTRMKIGDAGMTDADALKAHSAGKANTPTMGGVLIVGAIVATCLLLADLGKYEGTFVPHGTRYWFECGGDEPLEILRVSMNLPEDRV